MSLVLLRPDVIWPGDILVRNSSGPLAWAIRRATNAQWSHDALVVQVNGRLMAGDSLWNFKAARPTPLEEWERLCMERGCQMLVLRATGVAFEQGFGASAYWLKYINGRHYDYLALLQIGWSALWGRHDKMKLGMEADIYCTEGCQESCNKGGGYFPWAPKKKPTPGTTTKRLLAGRFFEVPGAFLPAGVKYKIQVDYDRA